MLVVFLFGFPLLWTDFRSSFTARVEDADPAVASRTSSGAGGAPQFRDGNAAGMAPTDIKK